MRFWKVTYLLGDSENTTVIRALNRAMIERSIPSDWRIVGVEEIR